MVDLARMFKRLYACVLLYLGFVMFADMAAAQISFLGVLLIFFSIYLFISARKKYSESGIAPVLDLAVGIGVLLIVATHIVHLLSNITTFAMLSLFMPILVLLNIVLFSILLAPLIFIRRAIKSIRDNKWRTEFNKWILVFICLSIILAVLNTFEPRFNMNKIHTYEQKFSSKPHHPMKVGLGNHVFLGYSFTMQGDYLGKENFSFPYLRWLLGEFKYAKPDFLRIGVSYDAWALNNTREQELADRYIALIRADHIPLFLTDTQHQQYLMGPNKLGFDEYAALQLKRTEFFVKRYRPEYYSIVTEVATYNDHNIRDRFDVDKWVTQTKRLAALVKNISPETKTVAYITMDPKESIDYFRKALNISSLDVIGLDFYTFDAMDQAAKLLDSVNPHAYGKELWVAETFYGLGWPCAPKSKENLDAEWLKMSYEFAQYYGADAYIPWPFEHLLTYQCAATGEKVTFSGHTKVMDAYLGILSDAKQPTP